MGLARNKERLPPVTWAELELLVEELRQMSDDGASSSQALIGLNRLFTCVERYLTQRGLPTGTDGTWSMEHWSFTLLRQLASRIEDNKESGQLLDEALFAFLDSTLLPRLRASSPFESSKSG